VDIWGGRIQKQAENGPRLFVRDLDFCKIKHGAGGALTAEAATRDAVYAACPGRTAKQSKASD